MHKAEPSSKIDPPRRGKRAGTLRRMRRNAPTCERRSQPRKIDLLFTRTLDLDRWSCRGRRDLITQGVQNLDTSIDIGLPVSPSRLRRPPLLRLPLCRLPFMAVSYTHLRAHET